MVHLMLHYLYIKCGHARRFGSPSAGSGPRLYCVSARPFAAAGHDPGPDRGRLHVGCMGDGGEWWARWSDTFWLGRWSLSLQSPPLPLSPSRRSRTCVRVGPPATGSGPTRPAGRAVAGRRPSYPSRIRVERAATRGAAGRGARCPSAAGAAPGQVCAAGPSRPVRASLRAGGWDQKKCAMKGAHTILKPEMSWFGQVYIPWLLWPVHSTSFTPG